jgi:hypothetical protein
MINILPILKNKRITLKTSIFEESDNIFKIKDTLDTHIPHIRKIITENIKRINENTDTKCNKKIFKGQPPEPVIACKASI